MPDGAPASVPGQPQQPQAPFGASSAVAPTANRGHEAAGMQKLGVIIQQLQDVLPLVGATSEIGQEVLKALQKFAKFVPAGSVTPAGQRNQLEQMAMKQGQNNQQMQALKAQQMQGQGGGAPGGAQMPQPKAA